MCWRYCKLKKTISFFLSLLMFFMLLPVPALASGNAADEPSAEETVRAVEGSQPETGSLSFLGVDNVDEAHAYHYRVEATVLESVTLTPQPDYTETSALSYQWLRFDAAQDTYVELPEKTGAELTLTVSDEEIGVEDLYACIVTAPDVAGVAMFTLTQKAPIDELEVPADEEVAFLSNVKSYDVLSGTLAERINSLKSIFPDEKFWNHYVSKASENGDVLYSKNDETFKDSVTSFPCATHVYGTSASVGQYDCNVFDGGFQCDGFARRVYYLLFGERKTNAAERYDTANLSVGDYVRIDGREVGHSGIVYSISGSEFKMIECNDSLGNAQRNCRITWGKYTYDKSRIIYFHHATNYNSVVGNSTKPAKTKDMSVNDYMTYYAQSVTAFSGTANPKNGTLKLYRLPETINNTVSYTTTTSSVKLTRKIVNSAGNTWYEISTGAFVWSGDITILATPTIANVVSATEGKGNTPLISFNIGWSSSNKPKSWKLEYGTTSSYGSKHEENFTDAVLNQYNPVPCSVQFGLEEPALRYNTVYYYRITVKSTNGDEATKTGSFTTGRCSIHNWSSGSITTQPTCCAAGVKTYTCTNPGCSNTKTEAVAATGQHSWNSGSITTPPTCTTAGVKTYTCTNFGCSATKTETVAATGQHTWDNGTVTEAAAPGKTGTKTYTCTICKLTKVESIPALPVTYTVSYDANGGTDAPDAQTKTHDVALTLSTAVPTRDSYTFLGWAASKTATAAQYQPGGSYTDNASVSLYAVWEENGPSAEEQLRTAIANGESEFYISDDFTLSADLTIPAAFALTVKSGTFTIPNGVTLSIAIRGRFDVYSDAVIQSGGKVVANGIFCAEYGGSITVEKGGILENNGFIGIDILESGSGSLHNYGTYTQTEKSCLEFYMRSINFEIDLIGIDLKFIDISTLITTEGELVALFAKADEVKAVNAYIFEGITLSADLTIPQNGTIEIERNVALTVPQNVTLTNNGEILLFRNGLLVIESGAVLVNNKEGYIRTSGSSHITIAGTLDMCDTAYAYIDADTWTCNGTILRNGGAIILYKDVTTADELEAALQSGATLVNVMADITLDRSVTIPKDVLLEIRKSVKLTIPAPYTLTSYGSINVSGTLDIGGTYIGEKIVVSGGTLTPDSIPHCTEGVLVNSITIDGKDTITAGGTTTFTAKVLPDDAFNPYVYWTIVSGEDLASIYSSGHFTAGNTPGTVTIRATAFDGSGIYAEKTITIIAAEPENPDAPQVVVSSEKAFPGETVKVTISIENNPGIVAAYFSVSYSDKLTLVSATDSGLLNDYMFDKELTSNPYNLSWSDASARENNMGNGVVATLEFLVAEDCEPGDLPVCIICRTDDTCNMDLDNVSFRAVDGGVTVTDYILGDVDGDGKVTTKDSILIRRYLLGGWNVTINENAADIDKDGKITTKDSILIRRYLLGGWDIELK